MTKRSFIIRSAAILLGITLGFGTLPSGVFNSEPVKAADTSGTNDYGIVETVGDINGDSEINAKDVTMLRRHLAGGWGVTVNEEDADINGDGEINAKDVTMLRRYLAKGWGVELPERKPNSLDPAAEDFINNVAKEYYYNQLSDFEKEVYTKYKKSSGVCESFEVENSLGLNYEELQSILYRALSALYADYPETRFKNSLLLEYSVIGDNIIVYLRDSGISEYVVNKANTMVDKIVEAVSIDSDAYTIVRNVAMYIEGYTGYNPYGASGLGESDYALICDHSALGVLVYKKAVCEGYADTAKILFDRLGIPCIIVGNAGHAWNYVMLEDGKWYALDLSNAKNFSEDGEELWNGFVTSNTFLAGSNGANYFNSFPYNISDLYIAREEDFIFPQLNGKDYYYDKDYKFTIEEIKLTDETDGKYAYSLNEDGETCTIISYEGKQDGDLIIPDRIDDLTVTKIGQGAFYSCDGFSGNLIIPDTVETIGQGAFQFCSGLKGELSLPDSLKVIDHTAFEGCTGLKGVLHIPDSVEYIGAGAFYDCSGFTGDLVIPEKITELGNGCFCGCEGLDGTCFISKNLKVWAGNSVLMTNFKEFVVDEENEQLSSVDGVLYDKGLMKLIACPVNKEGVLDIPDTVTEIGVQSCFECHRITLIKLPSSLKVIADRAFEGCVGIKGELILPDGVTAIGSMAFWTLNDTEGFTGDLIIPDSVLYIGDSAFYGNHFGGSLKISENIEEIKDSTFMFNKFSGDIVIPEKVKKIGAHAFDSQSNDNPTSIDGGKLILPKDIEFIGACAFMGAGLTGTIDITGVDVGENAFEGNSFDSIIG